MRNVERGAARDDGDRGPLLLAEASPQLRERLAAGRKDALRPPTPLRRGEQRAAAEEDDIGERTQEAHDEAVVVALVRDERVRALDVRDRDDPVQCLHEVRVDARAVEAEPAVVAAAKRGGQLALRQIVLLPEELQAHRTSARNSRRRSASSS